MIKTVDPLANTRWDAFITKHPDGTIFHHSAWARVLADNYGEVLEYYALENERGEISGALPFLHFNNAVSGNRLVCLPHSDHCFPLVKIDSDYQELLSGPMLEVDANKASSLEIRGWGSLGRPEDYHLRNDRLHLVHIVDLQRDLDSLLMGMTRNGRYNLRHAMKCPMTVRLEPDEQALKALHRFHIAASNRHRKTPVSYSFLRSILRHVIVPGHGFIFVAELMGRVAAVNLYLCLNGTALCMFSGQDPDYIEYRANYFLHWKAMEYFNRQAYRSYHFGGTDLEAPNLAFFKRCMGAGETARSFYYYPAVVDYSTPPDSALYRVASAALKILPASVKSTANSFVDKYFR